MTPRFRDALAIGFAAFFPLPMAWAYFVYLADVSESNSTLVTAYGVAKSVQFAFPLVFVLIVDPSRLRPVRPRSGGLLAGVAFALAVVSAMTLLYFGWLKGSPLLANTPDKVLGKLRQFGLDTPAGYLGMGLFIAVVHSMLEEYYWRWFIFGWMRRWLAFGPAMLLSGLGFMLHHVVVLGVYFPNHFWTAAIPLSLAVAVGGMVWAWLYERSGSLLGPWLSHAIIDAGILLVGFDMVREHW